MNEKPVLITGCAGFIGSTLVDKLLRQGKFVIGLDNFQTGKKQFIDKAQLNSNFEFIEFDLLRSEGLHQIFRGCDIVYHFAANADVRFGKDKPNKDLEDNTIATHKVLEAMRISSVKKLIFSSTGSIYGEARIIPTPELAPFPIQTSLYGASKLACEGLISAYCETFGLQAWIYRFVSILGPRYSHGHVIDFYSQLKNNSKRLIVLGNGKQKKSYLHVQDCLNGIEKGFHNSNEKINIFNLGIDGACEIRESIDWISNYLNLDPEIEFGTNDRGWIGDNPHIHLDISKIKNLGWVPNFSIKESVLDTLKYLEENQWILEKVN
jgi:UDP-glucose 4-epimerase